ncbi:MAG: DHHA1 domain-containing protein [Clostridium sp.]
MEKLYYENKYQREFTSDIEIIEEKNDGFHVVLVQTAFFPGGGGQHCDKGTIEGEEIIEIYEKKGIVYHVVKNKPKKLKRLKCEINWKARFDGMQQHLAQHVLSGCFFKLFNANTQSFHLGREACTVDIAGFLTEEQIKEVEQLANEIIMENIIVDNFVPTWVELKKLKLRRDLPTTEEEIRIVKIGDFDLNACCGLHPASTLELSLIKIKRWEKHKNATRIEYLSGSRAFEDYINRDEFSKKMCRELSCGEEEALLSISNLKNQIRELLNENKNMSNELVEYKMKDIITEGEAHKGYVLINKVYNKVSPKELSNIATKLTNNENIVALLATINEDKVNVIFTSSKNVKNIKMGDLLKDSITLIDGKGGGSQNLAQGAGKNNNNLEACFEYTLRKIKESI